MTNNKETFFFFYKYFFSYNLETHFS